MTDKKRLSVTRMYNTCLKLSKDQLIIVNKHVSQKNCCPKLSAVYFVTDLHCIYICSSKSFNQESLDLELPVKILSFGNILLTPKGTLVCKCRDVELNPLLCIIIV